MGHFLDPVISICCLEAINVAIPTQFGLNKFSKLLTGQMLCINNFYILLIINEQRKSSILVDR